MERILRMCVTRILIHQIKLKNKTKQEERESVGIVAGPAYLVSEAALLFFQPLCWFQLQMLKQVSDRESYGACSIPTLLFPVIWWRMYRYIELTWLFYYSESATGTIANEFLEHRQYDSRCGADTLQRPKHRPLVRWLVFQVDLRLAIHAVVRILPLWRPGATCLQCKKTSIIWTNIWI